MADLCECEDFDALPGDDEWCKNCDHSVSAHVFTVGPGGSWCEYDYNPPEDDQ